ncbi:MAG TPA: ABC transporter substrate-binding protein [Acetobacteraceae bacterium]|nr:ABC transporter substrate-binding protein [Acetobacteraceae bacterium]
MRARRCSTVLALLAAAFLTPRPVQADTLVVCTEASPDFLNPQLSTTSFDVGEQVFDRLLEIRTGGPELIPALAQSWTISPDGLIYTFELRHGVHWQSNARFTPTRTMNAEDVVFSFRRMFDKSDPFYQSADGNFPEFTDLLEANLAAVEQTSEDTVVFRLRKPSAPFLAALSMGAFPILSAEYAAHLKAAGRPRDLDRELIGTGPFSFVHYQKDAVVRLRAFPQFWGRTGGQPDRAAKVNDLVFAITPNPSVRYAKLRTDECQIARYPNPADFPAMRANLDIRLLQAGIAATNYIYFDTAKQPFDDKRVRRALAMAIDMPNLIRAVFQGSGTSAAALVPVALWGHDPTLQPYSHDPTAAKDLLTEAGYPSGFATELWAMPVVRPYMPNARRAAEMIQSDWAKIGVQAKIVTYEWGEYLKRIRDGDSPAGILGDIWDYPDPSEVMLEFVCGSAANAARFCNRDYDKAVQRANIVTDRAERTRLYQQAQRIIYDDVPLVRLADVNAYVAVRRTVTGFTPHFLGPQPYGGVSLGK